MGQPTFHAAVSMLFNQLGLDSALLAAEEHDYYTVRVDQVDIELVGRQAGFISFLCFPGELPTPSSEALSVLLAANSYQQAAPIITISLLDMTPAKVSIWSRLSLAQANTAELAGLFLRFAELARATHYWIQAGAPGLKDDGTVTERIRHESPLSTLRRLLGKARPQVR
ncbi:MAG TPA: CesT family type III secretion system chaperone [Noviherbaspirillum sp.]